MSIKAPSKPSFFERTMRPRFTYNVPVEVVITGNVRKVINKRVKAWTKERAKKQAMALCLKDVRFITGKITRVKGDSLKR